MYDKTLFNLMCKPKKTKKGLSGLSLLTYRHTDKGKSFRKKLKNSGIIAYRTYHCHKNLLGLVRVP